MSRPLHITYYGRRFLIDFDYADRMAKEGIVAFGEAREIYISDVYFRNHTVDLSRIRTVVDLGGNTGLFSVFAASFADHVVYVEANEKYDSILRHNMTLNGFKNFSVENVFVGAGGFNATDYRDVPRKTLDEIMNSRGMDYLDFLKIDIEGSEFELFKNHGKWLARVCNLSMEVHPECGDVEDIVQILERAGFDVVLEAGIYLSASNRANPVICHRESGC